MSNKNNSDLNINSLSKQKNLHLLFSSVIIIAIGLAYGLLPYGYFLNMFDLAFQSVDLSGIFRALMCLYIAIGIFWIVGIYKSEFWLAATVSNIFILSGLAIGRVLSLLLDGRPSTIFIIGLVVEILMAGWGMVNLRKYHTV